MTHNVLIVKAHRFGCLIRVPKKHAVGVFRPCPPSHNLSALMLKEGQSDQFRRALSWGQGFIRFSLSHGIRVINLIVKILDSSGEWSIKILKQRVAALFQILM